MTVEFEDMESELQSLSFDSYNSTLISIKGKRHEIETEFKGKYENYSNYALMISDQCPWHIVIHTEFEETTFSGSLIAQMHDSIAFIDVTNPIIKTENRYGNYKRFPTIAIKESIYNAIIHFDASMKENILIDISSDIMSIKSPGEIYFPNAWKDITCTNPRNWKMAQLLMKLGFIHLKGRGLNTIKSCYRGSGLVPMFSSFDDHFTMNLPAVNCIYINDDGSREAIESYLSKNHGATISKMSSDLFLSRHQINKILSSMEEDGSLFTMGVGIKKRIFLNSNTLVNREEIQQ